MIDILQANLEDLVTGIQSCVSKLKISDQQGENIDIVVSLVCGTIEQLNNLVDSHGMPAVPHDF